MLLRLTQRDCLNVFELVVPLLLYAYGTVRFRCLSLNRNIRYSVFYDDDCTARVPNIRDKICVGVYLGRGCFNPRE